MKPQNCLYLQILEDIEHVEAIFSKKWVLRLKTRHLKISKNQSTSSKNMLKSWNLAKLGRKMVQKKLPNHFFKFCIFWVKNPLCMLQMTKLIAWFSFCLNDRIASWIWTYQEVFHGLVSWSFVVISLLECRPLTTALVDILYLKKVRFQSYLMI